MPFILSDACVQSRRQLVSEALAMVTKTGVLTLGIRDLGAKMSYQNASDVCNRIYRVSESAIDVIDGNPSWFDQASSKIALIVGDAPIRYLDHNIATTDEKRAVILTFTDGVLVLIELDFDKDSPEADTRVIGRSELQGMSVGAVTNAVGYAGAEWPKRVAVSLVYGADTYNLPFRSYDPHLALELAALVPSLAVDLNR
ncbi:hypothetical protein [Cryobacterium lactosi]|nr:hypothetical protein [Cryobacterium lactosi]